MFIIYTIQYFFHIKPLFCEWRYLLSSIGIVTYSFGELAQFGRASDHKRKVTSSNLVFPHTILSNDRKYKAESGELQ